MPTTSKTVDPSQRHDKNWYEIETRNSLAIYLPRSFLMLFPMEHEMFRTGVIEI